MKGHELKEIQRVPLSVEGIPKIKRTLLDLLRPNSLAKLEKEKLLEMYRIVYDLQIQIARARAPHIIDAKEKEELEKLNRVCQNLILRVTKTYAHHNNELSKIAAVSNSEVGRFVAKAKYCLDSAGEQALEGISGGSLPLKSQEVDVEYDPVENVFQNSRAG